MATTRDGLNLLPHSDEAERAVIGAVLIDPDGILRTREVDLRPDDFYGPDRALIFEAACALADRFHAIDFVSVSDALQAKILKDGRNALQAVGGGSELVRYVNETPTSVHVRTYSEIVKRTAQQRRLIAVAAEITEQAYHHEGPIEGLYEQASREFYATVDVSQHNSHLYGTDEALIEYVTRLDERREKLEKNPDFYIKTGLPDIDRALGDIPGGILHIVVARPGVGKTIYMEQLAEYNAQRGHRVAFFHLELSHELMFDRRVARYSGVTVNELRRGTHTADVDAAMDHIRSWHENMVYVHCPGWSAERIAADIMRLHARGECEVAVVDYLQKIALPTSHSGLNASMLLGQVAEVMKNTAEQLDIPVVMGSQVNRDFKKAGDRRPHQEDIRNSGEIEEKANQIVVLHRPNDRQDGADRELIQVSVEKNTQGGSGGQTTVWHRLGRFRFESATRGATGEEDIDF